MHGQWVGVAASSDAMTSPIVGNVSPIIPRSMHAARDRKIRSDVLVMYAICRVSRVMARLSVPENRTTIAQRIGIPPSFAALIVMVTCMRSSALSPILSATCIPIRQLWHPVSAIAGSSATLTCFLSAKPRAR